MQQQSVHLECLELLLASITNTMGSDGLMSSFFFSDPQDKKPHVGRMGTTLYYHERELTIACLHVRRKGPSHLSSVSIPVIMNMLQQFVIDNYWYMFDEVWGRQFDGPYSEALSVGVKHRLAEALSQSPVFKPVLSLTIFPLVTVSVRDGYESESFFVLSSNELVSKGLPVGAERWAQPDTFPLLLDDRIKKETGVTAWIGVRSPIVDAAEKTKAAILGAMSLTLLPHHRYRFFGRHNFGGRVTISPDVTVTTSFCSPHTPAISTTIEVGREDWPWLEMLAEKLRRDTKAYRRELRALEYFYRAWGLDRSERFPVLCMSLDATYGDVSQSTQAVIGGVRGTLGDHVDERRLRKLMTLRGAVIHGGAPDVYDSSKYEEYYAEYGSDPISDMELVVAECLRIRVFGGELLPHADPEAEFLRQAQDAGRLPKRFDRATILSAPD